jgi:uncharacterized protein
MPGYEPGMIETQCIAFAGDRRIAKGGLQAVALAVKAAVEAAEPEPILIFDAATSAPVELDLRGDARDVAARYAAPASPAGERKGPGRPKLGVVAREVTLLPRHWEWLASQPGGASTALRKLVEAARKAEETSPRRAQEAAYRFMLAVGGDLPGYEDATRALFAGDAAGFKELTAAWPAGVRDHARELAASTFES